MKTLSDRFGLLFNKNLHSHRQALADEEEVLVLQLRVNVLSSVSARIFGPLTELL